MTAPLSPERLAGVRARWETAMTPQGYGADHQALMAARSAADVPDLLAALEAAQDEARALRLERQVLLDERVEVGSLRAALDTEEMEPYRDLAHYGKQAHRLGEARKRAERAEAALQRVRHVLHEWTDGDDEPFEPTLAEVIEENGAWRFARDLREAMEGKP